MSKSLDDPEVCLRKFLNFNFSPFFTIYIHVGTKCESVKELFPVLNLLTLG